MEEIATTYKNQYEACGESPYFIIGVLEIRNLMARDEVKYLSDELQKSEQTVKWKTYSVQEIA